MSVSSPSIKRDPASARLQLSDFQAERDPPGRLYSFSARIRTTAIQTLFNFKPCSASFLANGAPVMGNVQAQSPELRSVLGESLDGIRQEW